jgi:BirA family biotin operon repressor/biotin-[acetyl-CoA-carboxylase] ligase
VTARTARDRHTGRFEDVDSEGQLVLQTASGRQRIAAAEVFF